MNYWTLGDTAALDLIEQELSPAPTADDKHQQIEVTAKEVAQLERTGIAFPYDPVVAQNLSLFVNAGCNLMAKKYGEHWRFSAEECHSLAVASAQLLKYYIPDFDGLGPLGNFFIVAGGVLGPRALLTVLNKSQTTATQQQQPEVQT